jgi:anti-anti-sigma regulatory factor
MCSIDEEIQDDRTVLRVSGVFDSASACALRDRLARGSADRVTLDFSLVREFADLGVATLANGLAGGARRLTLGVALILITRPAPPFEAVAA